MPIEHIQQPKSHISHRPAGIFGDPVWDESRPSVKDNTYWGLESFGDDDTFWDNGHNSHKTILEFPDMDGSVSPTCHHGDPDATDPLLPAMSVTKHFEHQYHLFQASYLYYASNIDWSGESQATDRSDSPQSPIMSEGGGEVLEGSSKRKLGEGDDIHVDGQIKRLKKQAKYASR